MSTRCWNFRHGRGLMASSIAAQLALATVAASAQEEDDARDLLKAMTTYMAKQEKLSFDFQTTAEVVTPDFEKLQYVSSGTLTIQRPDKGRATRTGATGDFEFVSDGTSFAIQARHLDAYAQAEWKGTLDDLAERLEGAGVNVAMSDLIASDAFEALMEGVTSARHIATTVVGGIDCDYLAFRSSEVDWQVWIAQGDRPFPVRYVITSKHVTQAPQYTVQISNFRTGDEIGSVDFNFAPSTAKKVEFAELGTIDELPDQASEGAPQ